MMPQYCFYYSAPHLPQTPLGSELSVTCTEKYNGQLNEAIHSVYSNCGKGKMHAWTIKKKTEKKTADTVMPSCKSTIISPSGNDIQLQLPHSRKALIELEKGQTRGIEIIRRLRHFLYKEGRVRMFETLQLRPKKKELRLRCKLIRYSMEKTLVGRKSISQNRSGHPT